MTPTRTDLLVGQLDIAWSLFEYHADGLVDAECLWEPAAHHWTVRPDHLGRWEADFEVPEPDPVPAFTIGWVTWHIGFWWTTTLQHCFATEAVRDGEKVYWPGTAAAAVEWLRELNRQWRTQLQDLTDADLDSTDKTRTLPWGADMSLGEVAAWVNVELTKNVAEIGLLRILHRAQHAEP